MSSTQPPMACAPFDKAAFVNILLNTYKHPDFGPQYMNDNIQQVACKIQNLDNKYMVNFVCGVLGIIQRDIHAVRELIKNDEGEDPVYASYSTFFGLGTETTNPGIRVQINRAIDTARSRITSSLAQQRHPVSMQQLQRMALTPRTLRRYQLRLPKKSLPPSLHPLL